MDTIAPDLTRPQRHDPARSPARRINLALQGGGAHGAFTWGVLDRLLEDERLEVDGISGTSAGAMNGALLTYGMLKGGRACARELLERFWMRVSEMAQFTLMQPSWFDRMFGLGNLDYSPAYLTFEMLSRLLSPYQYHHPDMAPLRRILCDIIDFERLRTAPESRLFVSATNIRTGKIRVFEPQEMAVEVLLASACLPLMFRAVEIAGEHYWDGGFMGNPAMFPLVNRCGASDMVLVAINPIRSKKLPTTAREILDRMNDISFNSTLMREMRAIAVVSELVGEHLDGDSSHLRPIYFHMIEAEEVMSELGVSSKFNADPAFLASLRALGRNAAETWLATSFDKVGSRSSIDLEHFFF